MRITIACPKGLSDDANQLAMVLGQGAADGETFGALTWAGADGATYAVASLDTGPDFLDRATQPLTRPAWDLRPYQISMAGAARAQAALRVWTGGQGAQPEAVPQATPARWWRWSVCRGWRRLPPWGCAGWRWNLPDVIHRNFSGG